MCSNLAREKKRKIFLFWWCNTSSYNIMIWLGLEWKEEIEREYTYFGSPLRVLSHERRCWVCLPNPLMSIVNAWADKPSLVHWIICSMMCIFSLSLVHVESRDATYMFSLLQSEALSSCFNQCLRYFQPLFHTPSNLKYKLFTDSIFFNIDHKISYMWISSIYK